VDGGESPYVWSDMRFSSWLLTPVRSISLLGHSFEPRLGQGNKRSQRMENIPSMISISPLFGQSGPTVQTFDC